MAKRKGTEADPVYRRSLALKCASVIWRDRLKIRQIYDEARERSRVSGEIYHVDHYYPLQSQYCCGLHVHENLRVIKARANCRKSNSIPLDASPAIRAWIVESRGIDIGGEQATNSVA